LSLLGTSVRIYYDDVATRAIKPLYQAPTKTTFFRRHSWKVDGILSQKGFSKLREIVVDITTATAALSLYL